MDKQQRNILFTRDEYERFAEVIGSIKLTQFNDDQESYREVIYEKFKEWEE